MPKCARQNYFPPKKFYNLSEKKMKVEKVTEQNGW